MSWEFQNSRGWGFCTTDLVFRAIRAIVVTAIICILCLLKKIKKKEKLCSVPTILCLFSQTVECPVSDMNKKKKKNLKIWFTAIYVCLSLKVGASLSSECK